ncbi:MAG TPA: GNAT family N-acetyltransferase [Solirubrobacterales bacterium]|nr:GNAT family N-acetyltransferase [Solirubrobacterales bacterium]
MARGAITVRRCTPDDIEAVLHLWSLARSRHASTPDRREDVEALIDGGPAALLVAAAEEEVVGAVIAAWDGWRGNIYRLAVHPDYRRLGIGLRLTRAAEGYFRDRGVGRVTALVAFDDEAAASFWDSAGYPQDQEIGRRVRNLPAPESRP